MKKTPTIFERDFLHPKKQVIDKVHPGCEWVFAGEGVATRKIDGTCCAVIDGKLFRRRELKMGATQPTDFVLVDSDATTSKVVGWVPVGDSTEDRYHNEAWAGGDFPDGTYELVGPKVQGNPEGYLQHTLMSHNSPVLVLYDAIDRTFDGIRRYLSEHDFEGIVFHHPDGRMAKIKGRDFGLKRGG